MFFVKKNSEIIKARVRKTVELSEGRNFIKSAEKDELTGLYSRAFFFEYAGMMDRYYADLKTDAAILNVEHFHMVNEMYGRSFGDEVLKAIAAAISEFLSIAIHSEPFTMRRRQHMP